MKRVSTPVVLSLVAGAIAIFGIACSSSSPTPESTVAATVNGKKIRRTYASIRGWSHDAAYRLPALEGGSPEVVMVEGTEDALSVRACGWTGAVVATLGKGNIAGHSPPGSV